ncbi:hypothetical protein P9112_002729 [Eukaryota sp. TZLM1-RC]
MDDSYPPVFGDVKDYVELPSSRLNSKLSLSQKESLCKDRLSEIETFQKRRQRERDTTSAAYTGNERSPSRERLSAIRSAILQEKKSYPNGSTKSNSPIIVKSGLQLRSSGPPVSSSHSSISSSRAPFATSSSPPLRRTSDVPAGSYREPLTVPSTKGKGRLNQRWFVESEIESAKQRQLDQQVQFRNDLDSFKSSKQNTVNSPPPSQPFGPIGGVFNGEVRPSPRNYKRLSQMFHEEREMPVDKSLELKSSLKSILEDQIRLTQLKQMEHSGSPRRYTLVDEYESQLAAKEMNLRNFGK